MASHIRQCFRLKGPLCTLPKVVNLGSIHRARSDASIVEREINFQNEEFTSEQRRQIESVGRIEKIEVKILGPPHDVTLYMNQNISTPYDCGRHTTESVIERAALALVDSKTAWDMHRPLPASCTLKFLYFDDDDPHKANAAFWESCSIILGAVIANAFKDGINVTLHGYPPPDYRTGSFVYDAQISLENWVPNGNELRLLTAEMMKICEARHKFERLTVTKDIALSMFDGNPFKEQQIHEMSLENEDNSVTLYRIGRHIDISQGPLISNTNLIQMCSITAVHQIKTSAGLFYRFQGVALPKPLMLNHFAYGLLEHRARKLNSGRLPSVKMRVLSSG